MARYINADKLLEYIGATENCKGCPFVDNDIECRGHSLSRQDMCNIIEDLCEESDVIHCKDCKYYPAVRYADGVVIYESFMHCSDIAWESDGEGFCSWGERK